MSRRLITATGLLVIIVGAGYLYWQNSQQGGEAQAFPPSVIAATEITEEAWEPSLQSVGSLVAINGIDVSTEVSGIISELVFSSGQSVEKGQVLIKLDNSVDVAALDALRAERKLSKLEFDRVGELLKKNVASKSNYDEAKAGYEASDAMVKQQAAVIQRKVIRAPFAGQTGIRAVSLGQYIEAGEPIVSLHVMDPIYVDYTLSERYLSRVKTGQIVKARVDAVPGQVFSGEVSAVNSGIDVGTRTLKVRATLTNPDGVLRPGMFTEVETVTGEAEAVMTLPRTAISFNTYGNFVFIINEDDKGGLTVKRTPITTGEEHRGRVAIQGLPAGTKVVRTGLVKLRDGMAVIIDNQVELDDAEIKGE